MNTRIRELRKSLGLTMEAFGSSLGITKSAVSFIESGKSKITDRNISMICQLYHVNEEWLRTGEGDMFLDTSRIDRIAAFVADISQQPDSVQARLVDLLSQLDESEWYLLEKIFQSFLDN